MKKNRMYIDFVVVCLLIYTTLLLCWLWTAFKEQQKGLSSESDIIFKQAIQNEKKQRIGRMLSFHNPQLSPDDIPREEKNEWCIQEYLTYFNPNRSILDSLFQVSLIEKNIQAQSAIRYIHNGDTINTCPDSLFYSEAYALPPIVYRKDTNKDNYITLQAYVKFSFTTVLTRNPLIVPVFCLWLISLAGIIGVYYSIRNRRKVIALTPDRKSVV